MIADNKTRSFSTKPTLLLLCLVRISSPHTCFFMYSWESLKSELWPRRWPECRMYDVSVPVLPWHWGSQCTEEGWVSGGDNAHASNTDGLWQLKQKGFYKTVLKRFYKTVLKRFTYQHYSDRFTSVFGLRQIVEGPRTEIPHVTVECDVWDPVRWPAQILVSDPGQ